MSEAGWLKQAIADVRKEYDSWPLWKKRGYGMTKDEELQALRDEVALLRGALKSLARHSVIAGSRGEYRQGQLDVLESVHRIANAALTPQGGKGGVRG